MTYELELNVLDSFHDICPFIKSFRRIWQNILIVIMLCYCASYSHLNVLKTHDLSNSVFPYNDLAKSFYSSDWVQFVQTLVKNWIIQVNEVAFFAQNNLDHGHAGFIWIFVLCETSANSNIKTNTIYKHSKKQQNNVKLSWKLVIHTLKSSLGLDFGSHATDLHSTVCSSILVELKSQFTSMYNINIDLD